MSAQKPSEAATKAADIETAMRNVGEKMAAMKAAADELDTALERAITAVKEMGEKWRAFR